MKIEKGRITIDFGVSEIHKAVKALHPNSRIDFFPDAISCLLSDLNDSPELLGSERIAIIESLAEQLEERAKWLRELNEEKE